MSTSCSGTGSVPGLARRWRARAAPVQALLVDPQEPVRGAEGVRLEGAPDEAEERPARVHHGEEAAGRVDQAEDAARRPEDADEPALDVEQADDAARALDHGQEGPCRCRAVEHQEE